MELTVRRCADGREWAVDSTTELWVRKTLDSPAAAMHAVAVVDSLPGELASVSVQWKGEELFAGRVDSQRFSLSQKGRMLELDARSKGAALLDNEALPCTLLGPTMTTIFRLFAQPYGFVLVNAAPAGGLGMYTVHKGCCEWDALCGFARRVYGRIPHIDGDMLVVDRRRSAGVLTVGGGANPFTELAHTFAPYHMLSKVVLRGEDGNYHMAVDSSEAAYYGIQRKRYVIPPDEFCDAPGLDANQRIRRGLLQKDTVVVTMPGIVRAEPGKEVRICDGEFAMEGCMVGEVLYRQDRGGVCTTLTLLRGVYWD